MLEELLRLLTDACYLLNLEAEGQLARDEYERWRDRWIKEAGVVLKGVAQEKEEQE